MPVIAGRIGSAPYDIVLILHLIFMVVAFAPAFVWPAMNRLVRTEAGETGAQPGAGSKIIGSIVDPMMHGASMVLAGVFGIGLISMSDSVFEFSQVWVSIAFVLWLAMLGVFFGLLVPSQKAVRDGVVAADTRLAMSYGAMHLLLLLQVVVMVWKPGL